MDRLNPHRATAGATFTAHAALRPRTPSSYEIALGTPDQVAAHLARQGWQREAGRCAPETCRMRHPAGCLVVLYRSSALVQGARPQIGHDALRELVEVR